MLQLRSANAPLQFVFVCDQIFGKIFRFFNLLILEHKVKL